MPLGLDLVAHTHNVLQLSGVRMPISRLAVHGEAQRMDHSIMKADHHVRAALSPRPSWPAAGCPITRPSLAPCRWLSRTLPPAGSAHHMQWHPWTGCPCQVPPTVTDASTAEKCSKRHPGNKAGNGTKSRPAPRRARKAMVLGAVRCIRWPLSSHKIHCRPFGVATDVVEHRHGLLVQHATVGGIACGWPRCLGPLVFC